MVVFWNFFEFGLSIFHEALIFDRVVVPIYHVRHAIPRTEVVYQNTRVLYFHFFPWLCPPILILPSVDECLGRNAAVRRPIVLQEKSIVSLYDSIVDVNNGLNCP
ncbi:uncharacterized protein LOC113004406 [Solenopsis invicta]|uniref:uncharacterized protein LOC113004406 n=1 Tax=Solenopsis invicta TaxID=13686 RepID=UPI00193E2BAB|nr:uncharacterized protein LOC113004406 [Solenopsis invicta]